MVQFLNYLKKGGSFVRLSLFLFTFADEITSHRVIHKLKSELALLVCEDRQGLFCKRNIKFCSKRYDLSIFCLPLHYPNIFYKMNTTFYKQLLHPMVRVSETTLSEVDTLRTPVGCILYLSFNIYNYVKFPTSQRFV